MTRSSVATNLLLLRKASKKIRKNFEVRRFGIPCFPFPCAAKLAPFANGTTGKDSPILAARS
jgi:hypothetical protein